jgi:hypothetical protein
MYDDFNVGEEAPQPFSAADIALDKREAACLI